MSTNPYAPQWRVVCNNLDCGWASEAYDKGRVLRSGEVHQELKPGHTVGSVERITR